VARALRKRATDEERILWSQIHNRKLAGFKFRRQHQVGLYTLDFYCLTAKLSVELDGGQHGFPDQQARDERRAAYLAKLGIAEVRFWNHQVRRELRSVLATILRELQVRTLHLDPLPLQARGEEKRGRTPPLRFLGPRPDQSRHA
jgi:very-short-patch-repair endonuclease